MTHLLFLADSDPSQSMFVFILEVLHAALDT